MRLFSVLKYMHQYKQTEKMKIVRFCSKKKFLSSVPSLNLLKSHSIMNCVTMKLIRLQPLAVRQGQLGDVSVLDLLKPQGLRKYFSSEVQNREQNYFALWGGCTQAIDRPNQLANMQIIHFIGPTKLL